MKFESKIFQAGIIVMLHLVACGQPKMTNSKGHVPGDDKAASSDKLAPANDQNLATASNSVDQTNAALVNAMNAVTQIQIKKPTCRELETNFVTGALTRLESVATELCAGTVVKYAGKTFVLTAAHCLISDCINNDPTQWAFTGKGVFNKPPLLANIKIPAAPQVYDTVNQQYPTMNDFDWDAAGNVLVAKGVEFVTTGTTGGTFTANTFMAGRSNFNASAPGGGGLRGTVLTTMDIAVIDFGSVQNMYPSVTLPLEDFVTSSILRVGSATIVPKFSEHQKFGIVLGYRKSYSLRISQDLGDNSAALPVEFYGASSSTNLHNAFAIHIDMGMRETATIGCHGDSGGPAFNVVVGANGGYEYQMAGIASATNARCGAGGMVGVTYSAIKRLPIEQAIARLNANKVLFFPSKVDCWYPSPKNVVLYLGPGNESTPAVGRENCDRFIGSVISPVLKSNSTTILWKPLTLADGQTLVRSPVPGYSVNAIASDSLGTRTATFKFNSLIYGYYSVDLNFPKNSANASCLKANYETTPLRIKTVMGSKVVTILAEGVQLSATSNLGAWSANEIAVGDPIRGTGIPAGALVYIAPTTRQSSTFTMSVAATATSATTGTPLIITHTFRSVIDQKIASSADSNVFTNVALRLLPFKRPATVGAFFESNVWVPPLMNTLNPGPLTITLSDKGCKSAGRMVADSVQVNFINKLK